MAKKKNIKIGLDIGSFSLKYTSLISPEEGSYRLSNFGVIKTSKEKLAEDLSALAKELPEKSVNVAISGPSVVVRYVQMPKMKNEELRSSLQFEAEKYIPFDMNEVILDHQILDPDVGGKMRVLLVAAKKEAINNRVKLLESAGLTANVIDVDSFALINAFCLNNPSKEPDKITALLNIGNDLSSIDVISHGVPYFSRDFMIGGGDITKSIADKLKVNTAAAERLKHDPGEKLQEITDISKQIFSSMADEVRLSLSYYEHQFGNGVNELYLSGGACNQKELIDYLSDALGLSCQLWNPVKSVPLEPKVSKEELEKVGYELSVAVGLAMRE